MCLYVSHFTSQSIFNLYLFSIHIFYTKNYLNSRILCFIKFNYKQLHMTKANLCVSNSKQTKEKLKSSNYIYSAYIFRMSVNILTYTCTSAHLHMNITVGKWGLTKLCLMLVKTDYDSNYVLTFYIYILYKEYYI